MTTKTPPQKQEQPPVDETRMAYEAHTLARMLYGQLAMTHPWTMTAYPPGVHGTFGVQPPFRLPQQQPPQMTFGPSAHLQGWGWGR